MLFLFNVSYKRATLFYIRVALVVLFQFLDFLFFHSPNVLAMAARDSVIR